MESIKKWTCATCTYENWPASKKCIICHTPRNVVRIEEDTKKANTSIATTSPTIESQVDDIQGKWTCPSCTYSNWPKALRCVQCYFQSPMPEDANAVVKSSQPADNPAAHLQVQAKWTCPKCTYENWPKSAFCIMCRCVQPRDATETSHHPDFMPRQQDVSKYYQNQNVSLNNSEKLWLDACEAVVTDGVTAVEKYLLATGRLDRRLTKQDCRILDKWLARSDPVSSQAVRGSSQPRSPFKVGFTLVDLSISLERADLISLFIPLQHSPSTLSSLTVTHLDCLSLEAVERPEGGSPSFYANIKRTPCQAAPQIAKELRRHLSNGIRQCRGDFPCSYFTEWGTFALPSCIKRLPAAAKQILFSRLCDSDVQSELEKRSKAINWWMIEGKNRSNRLFALWNRTAGDCLLDSLLQAAWGIFDSEGSLRLALSESLSACESKFYPVWREYEAAQAAIHYTPEDCQLRRDWQSVLSSASQPRESLEQFHIFVLCHILRRPIIVYGVKYINNYRDEPIGIANFQGVYLPLLLDRSFCSCNPLILGYTRGHFTALVPMEPVSVAGAPQAWPNLLGGVELSADSGAPAFERCETPFFPDHHTTVLSSMQETISGSQQSTSSETILEVALGAPKSEASTSLAETIRSGRSDDLSTTSAHKQNAQTGVSIYLPLFDRYGSTLPVHFASLQNKETLSSLLRNWLEVVSTPRGLLLTRLRLQPRHHLVDEMIREWLSYYLSLAQLQDTEPQSSLGYPPAWL